MATCGSCGAPINWAWTTNDKLMPVDAEPVADGNVELTGLRSGYPIAIVHGQPSMFGFDLHKSHFATCPEAAEWRRHKAATA